MYNDSHVGSLLSPTTTYLGTIYFDILYIYVCILREHYSRKILFILKLKEPVAFKCLSHQGRHWHCFRNMLGLRSFQAYLARVHDCALVSAERVSPNWLLVANDFQDPHLAEGRLL